MKKKKIRKYKGGSFVTAAGLIALGLLFILFKGEVISIAMSIIGISLIVWGVVNLANKLVTLGTIKIVLGAFVLLAGWLLVTLALYVLGACLLVWGISDLYRLSKVKIKKVTLPVALHIAQPIIYILVALTLFFNQGGALSWMFTVSGIFLLVDGVVALIGALDR